MNILLRIKEKIFTTLMPKLRPSGYYAVRSVLSDLKRLVDKDNPVIVDGGANLGDLTQKFLTQYKNPTIYCIEPHQESARQLEKKFASHGNVHVIDKALGNQTGQVQFNVSNNLPSSSFLQRTEWNKEYHGDFTATQSAALSDMVRLADLFPDPMSIDLLKLDVEGYELEVLMGAENILSNIRIIMAEVWFVGSYQGAPYSSDIEAYLRRHNFTLLNLYNPYTHPNAQLTTADAAFLNRRFFPDRQSLTSRIN